MVEQDAPPTLNRRWHLARSAHEECLAEMEYALMRSGEAFSRWQTECLAAVSGVSIGGGENAILHVIRLNDRPKSLKEIARLLNRDDIPNLQYTLRKLIKLELAERHGGGRAGAVYTVTEQGRQVTEDYANLRAELMVQMTEVVPGLDDRLKDATRTLDLLSGIYEQAARVAATHRAPAEDI